jgi:alpha-D-ribose 1-methylphosphonate 5-triphosphate synthase subunit PhnH
VRHSLQGSAICERWLEQAQARERAADVLAEPDAAARLRGAASWLADLYAAGFDVVLILDAAIDEDAETRTLLRAKLAGRNQVMDAMISSLEDDLRGPVAEAQAVYRALAAPGVYQELVEAYGWTPDQFARWVADVLQRHLVDDRPDKSHQRPARAKRQRPYDAARLQH